MQDQFPTLSACASLIAEAGYSLNTRGWTPATSSNFSMRLDQKHCAITVSGKHKGRLQPDDVMVVDLEGKALDDRKPSAETLLHTQLYDWSEDIGAVLHTHSSTSTILSLHWPTNTITFSGYEILKAFPGINTHDISLTLPIFENTQDIPSLAGKVSDWLNQSPNTPAYLIRGHGVYTWGTDMPSCERHLEALEFLLECTLKLNQTKLSNIAEQGQ